jgi:hypothetical protein
MSGLSAIASLIPQAKNISPTVPNFFYLNVIIVIQQHSLRKIINIIEGTIIVYFTKRKPKISRRMFFNSENVMKIRAGRIDDI